MNFEKPKFENEKKPENTDEKFQKIMENEPELVENLKEIWQEKGDLSFEEKKDSLEKWYQEQKERADQGLIPKETMEAIEEVYKKEKDRINHEQEKKE